MSRFALFTLCALLCYLSLPNQLLAMAPYRTKQSTLRSIDHQIRIVKRRRKKRASLRAPYTMLGVGVAFSTVLALPTIMFISAATGSMQLDGTFLAMSIPALVLGISGVVLIGFGIPLLQKQQRKRRPYNKQLNLLYQQRRALTQTHTRHKPPAKFTDSKTGYVLSL